MFSFLFQLLPPPSTYILVMIKWWRSLTGQYENISLLFVFMMWMSCVTVFRRHNYSHGFISTGLAATSAAEEHFKMASLKNLKCEKFSIKKKRTEFLHLTAKIATSSLQIWCTSVWYLVSQILISFWARQNYRSNVSDKSTHQVVAVSENCYRFLLPLCS